MFLQRVAFVCSGLRNLDITLVTAPTEKSSERHTFFIPVDSFFFQNTPDRTS